MYFLKLITIKQALLRNGITRYLIYKDIVVKVIRALKAVLIAREIKHRWFIFVRK